MSDRDWFREFGVAAFGFLAGNILLALCGYSLLRRAAAGDGVGAGGLVMLAEAVLSEVVGALGETVGCTDPAKETLASLFTGLEEASASDAAGRTVDLSDLDVEAGLADELGLDAESLDLSGVNDGVVDGLDIDVDADGVDSDGDAV